MLGTRPRGFAFILGLAVAGIPSCGRDRGAPVSRAEAPSSSVFTLGASLGACDDRPTCERECDAGSADRCRRLAVSYALGRSGPKDEAHATTLYEQACSMGDAAACVFAGQMHEYAHGVPKNEAAAGGFYERGCDLGWAAGCYNLAILIERGHGVAQDVPKAAKLYGVVCRAGAKQACEMEKELLAALREQNEAGQ